MRRLRFLALTIVLGLSAASCADPSNSFYIRNLGVPDPDNSCQVLEGQEVTMGNWDVASGSSYSAVLLLESMVRARKTDLNADPNSIRVEEIEVRVSAPNGSEIAAYTTPANGFIPSSIDGVTPGSSSMYVPLIPASLSPALSSLQGQFITVELKARGHTLGTTKVETGPFTFTVAILTSGSLAYSAADCAATTDPAVDDPCQPGFNGGQYCP